MQLDDSPLVVFNDNLEPLIPQQPGQTSAARDPGQLTQARPKGELDRDPSSISRPAFPINKLAPVPQNQYPPPYNPPTPPPEDDDSEAMDWTPSQQSLPAASSYRTSKALSKPPQPSPFYGRLPPNPRSLDHRLRNPPPQPTFHLASTEQKQSFFRRPPTRQSTATSVSGLSETSDFPDDQSIDAASVTSPQFSAPKFFPKSDMRSDTGLENMFDSAFTFGEDFSELATPTLQQPNQHDKNLSPPSRYDQQPYRLTSQNSWRDMVSVLLLSITCIACFTTSRPESTYHHIARSGVTALVAFQGLSESINRADRSSTDVIIYTMELFLATVIGVSARTTLAAEFALSQKEVETAGVGLLGLMWMQEAWGLTTCQWR